MPIINALIQLDELRCDRESDGNGHSEPYLWPALFQVDDDTLASPVLVSIGSAPSAPFRVIVQDDMPAGQAAPMVVNPCQAELDRVNIASHTVENIKGALRQLHNQPESPRNEAEIDRLQAELFAENTKLKAAQQALRACLHLVAVGENAAGGVLHGTPATPPPAVG